MKKHFKRALSLLLAILLCIGMLPVSASAADLTIIYNNLRKLKRG